MVDNAIFYIGLDPLLFDPHQQWNKIDTPVSDWKIQDR